MRKKMSRARKSLLYVLVGSGLFLYMPFIANAVEDAAETATTEDQAAEAKVSETASSDSDVKQYTLPTTEVTAKRDSRQSKDLPPAYAGGQVARGSRLGVLGNKDFLDTPFNITSYTDKLIENQQSHTLAGVVANDPSVRFNSGSSSYDTWTIRGFTLSCEDMGFNGLYGLLPNSFVGTELAERVEVLKGPSALVNGMQPAGSIGGSINLIPKRAGEEPLTSLTIGYTGDSQLGGHIDIGRRFGENNRFGVRFNGAYRQGDTGFDGESREVSLTALGLDVRGKRFRAAIDLGYQEVNQNAPTTSLILSNGLSVPALPKNTFNFSPPWTYANNKNTFGVIHGEFDLNPDWMIFASAGARKNTWDYILGSAVLTNAQGDFTASIDNFPLEYHVHTEELGIRGQFTSGSIRHQLVLSGTRFNMDRYYLSKTFYTFSSNLYRLAWGTQPDIPDLGTLPLGAATTLSSVVLADTLSTADGRLQLTVGARRQQIKVDNYSPAGTKTSTYSESATTPSVGLVIKARPNLSFYGNYIEGLQQGATAPATAANAGEIFAPFKSKQYEA
ncbi:MAG TPA: TonB-dependent receptor plug domain-containing protein, partial [Methylomusa anaerophila]